MRISVVVPVYNEEETVVQVLESLSKVPLDLEVIVVDDASTDRTWEILQELRQREPFNTYRYIHHDFNQGKGAGLRDRKSTRLNSSHANISYAVFCLKKKKNECQRLFV